jgi:HNH endonuclease
MHLVLGSQIEIDFSQPWHDTGPIFVDPRLAPCRLAQQAFKAVVLSTYHGHCAITGTKIRPVLQAAHIKPVANGGENRIDNGLLLRSDVHTLYDDGYLAVELPTGCRSALGYVMASATASSTTRRPTSSSNCRRGNWSDPAGTSSNGTWTPFSRPLSASAWLRARLRRGWLPHWLPGRC